MAVRDLDKYIKSVKHEYIDVDGVFGGQCWDQWSHYATKFLGVPTELTYTRVGGWHKHDGYACQVYHMFGTSGLSKYFKKVTSVDELRPGDVLFWDFGTVWFPWSHVATFLGYAPNGMLRCLTQNPGYVQISDLIKNGFIGALRPKVEFEYKNKFYNKTKPITNTAKEEAVSKTVQHVYTVNTGTGSKHKNLIFDSASGFVDTFGTGGQTKYVKDMKKAYGVSTPTAKVTNQHFDRIIKNLAKVRQGK